MYNASNPWENAFKSYNGMQYSRDKWYEHININGYKAAFLMRSVRDDENTLLSYSDDGKYAFRMDDDELNISAINTTIPLSVDLFGEQKIVYNASDILISTDDGKPSFLNIRIESKNADIGVVTYSLFAPEISIIFEANHAQNAPCILLARKCMRLYNYVWDDGINLFDIADSRIKEEPYE